MVRTPQIIKELKNRKLKGSYFQLPGTRRRDVVFRERIFRKYSLDSGGFRCPYFRLPLSPVDYSVARPAAFRSIPSGAHSEHEEIKEIYYCSCTNNNRVRMHPSAEDVESTRLAIGVSRKDIV